MPTLTSAAVRAIRRSLLAWYDAGARPLPWRATRDPYAIWVSEVMSQQTRVETVIPYWERWLSRFPDVAALADAPVDDVLRAWEGLGYYSRARNLHDAARIVRERHAGKLPAGYDALRALPGVGEYTAGAVASIAFGERRPAVDGNVRRVLARVLDAPGPPGALLRATATALLPADRPGDLNQALMELGARICSPRAPRCGACPIGRWCRAHAAGTQLERPAPRSRTPIPTIDLATAVIRGPDARVLIVRRPARGLLAGLWSFPSTAIDDTQHAEHAAREIAGAFGIAVADTVPLGTIEHTFSHRRERYHVFGMRSEEERRSGGAEVEGRAWVDEEAREHALPRAQRRILRLAFDVCA